MNKSVSEWFSRFSRRGGDKEETYYLCPAYRPYQENDTQYNGDEGKKTDAESRTPPSLIPVERTNAVLAERQGLPAHSVGGGKKENISGSGCNGRKKDKIVVQLENEQSIPLQSDDGVYAEERGIVKNESNIKGMSSLRASMSKLHLLKRQNSKKLVVEAGPLALHKEIRRLKELNSTLDEKIENLTAENKSYQDRVDAVVEVHAHLRSENERKQLKIEELEALSRQLKQQNEELQNGASEAERNATFQNLLLELRKQITGLKQAVSDGEREAASLRDQLSAATNEKTAAARELDNAQKRISSLERERKIVHSMQKNIEREQYSARLRDAVDKAGVSLGMTQSVHLGSGIAAEKAEEHRGLGVENDENAPPVKPFVAPAASKTENRVLQC